MGEFREFLNEKQWALAHTKKETEKLSALAYDGNLLKRLTKPRKRACSKLLAQIAVTVVYII